MFHLKLRLKWENVEEIIMNDNHFWNISETRVIRREFRLKVMNCLFNYNCFKQAVKLPPLMPQPWYFLHLTEKDQHHIMDTSTFIISSNIFLWWYCTKKISDVSYFHTVSALSYLYYFHLDFSKFYQWNFDWIDRMEASLHNVWGSPQLNFLVLTL